MTTRRNNPGNRADIATEEMFYVQSEDRKTWNLTSGTDLGFVPLPHPIIVHSKLLGRFKKAVPVVAVAMSMKRHDTELLVKISKEMSGGMGDGDWYQDQFWETIRLENTQEGFRLKKHVLKLIELFRWLAKEQGKTDRRQQREASIAEARGHREGMCPVCYGSYIVRNGTMVLHGYQRPGWGHVVGDCFGVGFMNLEVSSDGLEKYILALKNTLEHRRKALKDLPRLDTLTRGPRWIGDNSETFKRGETGFDKVFEGTKRKMELEIKHIQEDVLMRTRTLTEWKPQKWPRVDPPNNSSKKKG